jgi:hypothetical protein
MKRFAIIFAANYASMILLFAFLLFVAPEVFPGDPPLTGIDRLLDWIASPVEWFTVVYTFPSFILADHVPLLVCILIPSAVWAGIFIYARRYWRVDHAA